MISSLPKGSADTFQELHAYPFMLMYRKSVQVQVQVHTYLFKDIPSPKESTTSGRFSIYLETDTPSRQLSIKVPNKAAKCRRRSSISSIPSSSLIRPVANSDLAQPLLTQPPLNCYVSRPPVSFAEYSCLVMR